MVNALIEKLNLTKNTEKYLRSKGRITWIEPEDELYNELCNGLAKPIEDENYKIVCYDDYNAGDNIGYDSSHYLVINKKTFEIEHFYLGFED